MLGRPATPFVADFVGADRGIKRLGVLRIDESTVTPGPVDGLPVVPLGATLRDVLAVMLTSNASRVGVKRGETPLGTLKIDDLFATASS